MKSKFSIALSLAVILSMLLASLALAAEMVTAELTGTANDVTVTQGSSVSFTISVSATGNVSCVQTPENPSTATVDTVYSISAGGAVSSHTPSSAMSFYTNCLSNNGPVTWDGAPTAMAVSATVSAAATTPVGDYNIILSPVAGTTDPANPNTTGGKLEDTTATTINLHVVAASKQNQATLILNAASPQTYGTTQTLSTSGGSGTGAVSFSLTSGPCTLVGDQLTADSGTGSCVVGATKAADDNFNAASASAVTVTLQKANQATLILNATSPQTYGTTQTLSTSGGSGTGTVSFSLTSGPCTLVGDQLTANSGTGSCVVGATKAADDNYNEASASATVTLQKADQTITITTSAPSSAMYNTSFTVAATASSGLPVAYSAAGGCSNVGATFTMTSGITDCTVKYNQAGDGNYNAAPELTEAVDAIPWTLNGFYQPVDMFGVFNVVKGGSTVPLKFNVFAGSTELTDVANVTPLKFGPVACDAVAPNDAIETLATGETSLRYDSTSGQFIYNWKTPKTPGCYSVTMKTLDGSSLVAFFRLK